jgi:hypothetical protein
MEVKMKKRLVALSLVLLVIALPLAIAAPALAAGPNAQVSISAMPQFVQSGGYTTLIVTEKNTGSVAFDFVNVYLYAWYPDSGVNEHLYTFAKGSVGWIGGDANRNGILDPGETWYWAIREQVTVETEFSAYGDCQYQGNPLIIDQQNDFVKVQVYGHSWCWWWWWFGHCGWSWCWR